MFIYSFQKCFWRVMPILLIILISAFDIKAQISTVGGFEGALPSYWKIGAAPSGSTLSWATDQSRSMGKSLKIKKTATSEAAVWESYNMADFWSPTHSKNVDMKIGAWVMTSGVNTNPTTEDEKWKISYTFYDTTGALMGTTTMDIDQSAASSGAFYADTNGVGATILPKDSYRTIIKFTGGKDATGTVWADDFMLYGRGGAWAGQNWNTSVGVPSGWIYWVPPIGGNNGEISKGFENTVVTTAEAHSGLHSLKFNLPLSRATGDAFVGTKRMLFEGTNVTPGDYVRISVWLKASNLVPDSAALYPTTYAVGFTYGFWKGVGNNDGWNSITGYPKDMQFVLPAVTSFGWTQYFIDVQVPNDPLAVAMSVRLHAYARFTGTVYWDDLKVEKLDVPDLNIAGGFEGALPSYWKKGAAPSGSTLSWATDQSRSMGKSLKIKKDSTSEAAVWESYNMADFWSPQHSKDVDIKVGAWVRTDGVNTNPTTENEKWKISYTFYDSAGSFIGQTVMDIDQSTASSGAFYADTNGIGATILPKNSWKTIIKFTGGKNATGTVWADDFMLYGRGGAWAGQNWNTSVGVPSGWIYWVPPIGGNNGEISKGFENTVVTTAEAHSGLHSLKFNLPLTRETGDAFVGTKRMLLKGTTAPTAVNGDLMPLEMPLDVTPGDYVRISVWLKASNLVPDSAALYPTTYAVGFTYGFWKGVGNNDGWNSITGYPIDMQFVLPAVTSFGWTQYFIDVQVPSDPLTKAMSVRLHAYARFTGTVYWDDLKVEKIDVPDLNIAGGFEGALPSYWKKGAAPSGSTLSWATDQFRSMGKSLKITKTATTEAAVWESYNMADFWSPQHSKNVDIKIGAWVRTQGVNTNPATEDAKWKIGYLFYDSAGSFIGSTVMDIDQSTASSGAFYADTNGIGATILPKNSWKTIIKFTGGKDATGTVWADDFMLYGRGGAWAGQNWNTSVGVPSGWIYWVPPIGGNNGEISKGFENTVVTTAEAHTGLHSLKFDLPLNRVTGDAFVGTKRMLFKGRTAPTAVNGDLMPLTMPLDVAPGDMITISVWLKASNLVPDSAALYPTTYAVGFTYGFWKGVGNNDGWNSISGFPIDMQFVLPAVTSFDWTQYSIDVQVPNDPAAVAMSVRLHAYARFTGTVYWDDLKVEKSAIITDVGDATIPVEFSVSQNYPNPFNPSTTIRYAIPQQSFVVIKVYDIIGREVKTLVNVERSPGIYNVQWNGDNNYGSKVATGIYIYRVIAGNFTQVKKMILLK